MLSPDTERTSTLLANILDGLRVDQTDDFSLRATLGVIGTLTTGQDLYDHVQARDIILLVVDLLNT